MRLVVLLLALGALAAGMTFAVPRETESLPRRKPAYPMRFPEGPGRSIAQQSCLICHSAMLVTQQHKDSTGWERTVQQMEAWGVKVSPAERESLMLYLRDHFGPVAKR